MITHGGNYSGLPLLPSQVGFNFGFSPPKGSGLILAENEIEPRGQVVFEELERRKNLGYGLGVGIGRFLESRWGPLPPDQGWADVWGEKLLNWWQGNKQALAKNETAITPQTSSQDLLEEYVKQEPSGKLTVKINPNEIAIPPAQFIPEFVQLVTLNQPIIERYGLDPKIFQEKLYHKVKGLSDSRISMTRPNYFSGSLDTLSEILSENEVRILESIPENIKNNATTLKNYLEDLEPSQQHNFYVLNKLRMQSEIWEKMQAHPGYQGYPFDQIDKLVTRGEHYQSEEEPGYMLAALEGLLESLNAPVNNMQSYEQLHDTTTKGVSSRFGDLYGDFDGPFMADTSTTQSGQEAFLHSKITSVEDLEAFEFNAGVRDDIALEFGIPISDQEGLADLAQRSNKNSAFVLDTTDDSPRLYLPAKTSIEVKTQGDLIFKQYNRLSKTAKTPIEKLLSNIWLARELKLNHAFEDGNGRSSYTLFMGKVFADQYFPGIFGFDPDIFDGHGPEKALNIILDKMVEFANNQAQPHRKNNLARINELRKQSQKHFRKEDNTKWQTYHNKAGAPNSVKVTRAAAKTDVKSPTKISPRTQEIREHHGRGNEDYVYKGKRYKQIDSTVNFVGNKNKNWVYLDTSGEKLYINQNSPLMKDLKSQAENRCNGQPTGAILECVYELVNEYNQVDGKSYDEVESTLDKRHDDFADHQPKDKDGNYDIELDTLANKGLLLCGHRAVMAGYVLASLVEKGILPPGNVRVYQSDLVDAQGETHAHGWAVYRNKKTNDLWVCDPRMLIATKNLKQVHDDYGIEAVTLMVNRLKVLDLNKRDYSITLQQKLTSIFPTGNNVVKIDPSTESVSVEYRDVVHSHFTAFKNALDELDFDYEISDDENSIRIEDPTFLTRFDEFEQEYNTQLSAEESASLKTRSQDTQKTRRKGPVLMSHPKGASSKKAENATKAKLQLESRTRAAKERHGPHPIMYNKVAWQQLDSTINWSENHDNKQWISLGSSSSRERLLIDETAPLIKGLKEKVVTACQDMSSVSEILECVNLEINNLNRKNFEVNYKAFKGKSYREIDDILDGKFDEFLSRQNKQGGHIYLSLDDVFQEGVALCRHKGSLAAILVGHLVREQILPPGIARQYRTDLTDRKGEISGAHTFMVFRDLNTMEVTVSDTRSRDVSSDPDYVKEQFGEAPVDIMYERLDKLDEKAFQLNFLKGELSSVLADHEVTIHAGSYTNPGLQLRVDAPDKVFLKALEKINIHYDLSYHGENEFAIIRDTSLIEKLNEFKKAYHTHSSGLRK